MSGIAVLSVTLALVLGAPWMAAGLESAFRRRALRRTLAVLARAGIALNERDSTSAEQIAAGANRTLDRHEIRSLEERERDQEEA